MCGTAPAAAQSITVGEISGVVSAGGAPLPGAIVTLEALGGGSSQEATSGPSGAFLFGSVPPGAYQLRIEAIGFRPLIARPLSIGGGDHRGVALSLTPARPPVVIVDSVSLAIGASNRLRPGGAQFGTSELYELPHRFGDLASVAALSPAFDESLGAQGLPGDMTLIIADGLPYHRAPHPSARAEQIPDGLFPGSSLSGLTAFHNAPDIERAGAAGGYVSIATRPSTGEAGFEVDGAYSGGFAWQSSQLDLATPSLLTAQGGMRGTLTPSPGSRLVLSAEALRQQTPLGPRVGESLAADLGGLDPDLLESLVEPGRETYARYSGMARLDVRSSRTSGFFFRGAGSYVERGFEGTGPLSLARTAAPAESSIAFSVAGGLVSQPTDRLAFELRAGVSGSFRDFDRSVEGAPPAFLASEGAALGDLASATGASSRTDVVLTPVVRYTSDFGSIKLGTSARASSHAMEHSPASFGDFAFTDAAALLARDGFAFASHAPRASFGTQEIGVFGQYDGAIAQGLRVSLGARYDLERIPADGAELNVDWLAASGIDNRDVPTSFEQIGVRGSLEWDPVTNGGTHVFLVGSLHEGDLDPRVIYEWIAQDTEASSVRYLGSGVEWPGGLIPPGPSELPTLTLLGPDTRPPRTLDYSVGISQRVTGGFSMHARGSQRRTDFLMRRRNLNRPLVAQARDVFGREILGTLAKDGSLVAATGDDARRFPDFGDVWALDPDGWSEYRGVTVGLEYADETLDAFASYTVSETTDNWVGAASGMIDATTPPGLPGGAGGDGAWSVGTSDFDAPHRIAGGVTARFGPASVSGVYHFRSGLPFTPRYRYGVDANGDGSLRNDVAFVPGDAQLAVLLDDWPCLDHQAGEFAKRNSCRGPGRHGVDARIRVEVGSVGGARASVVLDGLNLIEGNPGVIDDALVLVDPTVGLMTAPDGTVTIPMDVNPDFGTVRYPTGRGRMFRLGVRIGG